MSAQRLVLLSLLSGVLLFLSWPPHGIPFLLFIAFVPLLMVEQAFSEKNTPVKRIGLFWFSLLAFLVWNIPTTFWVCNATIGGGIAAILANSLIMAGVFWIFHVVKSRLTGTMRGGHWLFVLFWLAYEYIHHNWELTWPWLGLGNAFAAAPEYIQWYEYTGTCGGSLWVLALNIFFLDWLNGNTRRVFAILPVMLIPAMVSLWMYRSFDNGPVSPSSKLNIVIVQPNIDPYSEKFSDMNFEEQLQKMLTLAKQQVDSTTDYLVFPETALTESIWENDLPRVASVHMIKEFMKPFPKLKVIAGAATWKLYEEGEPLSASARKFKKQDGYYDAFNTAMYMDAADSVQLYHKSKLVPGVERMPYPALFGFLEMFAIDLGGTAGSLGTQEERGVFIAPIPGGSEAAVAPVICYESIFGEFVTEYVHKGANVLFIITNDGWWGNTPGYKQHLDYGRLRAIETRREIARSANTGISCFINTRGDLSQETAWWEPAVIKGTVGLHSRETFYVQWGDVIWRVAFFVSILCCLAALLLRFIRRQ